jgi:hypothetical protein
MVNTPLGFCRNFSRNDLATQVNTLNPKAVALGGTAQSIKEAKMAQQEPVAA